MNLMKADNNHRRLAAWILAATIILSLILSFSFEIKEANHDCQGESCPICAMIQQFEDNFRSAGPAVPDTSDAIAVCSIALTLCTITVFVVSDTLISRKVRLND